MIGGTIEVETSGWADREPRFWHIDGRGGKCGTGKLGYPADATMTMTVASLDGASRRAAATWLGVELGLGLGLGQGESEGEG